MSKYKFVLELKCQKESQRCNGDKIWHTWSSEMKMQNTIKLKPLMKSVSNLATHRISSATAPMFLYASLSETASVEKLP